MWNPLDCCEGTAEAPVVSDAVVPDGREVSGAELSPSEEFLVRAYRLANRLNERSPTSPLDQIVVQSVGRVFRQVAEYCEQDLESAQRSSQDLASMPAPESVGSASNLTAAFDSLSDDEETATGFVGVISRPHRESLSDLGLPERIVSQLSEQGVETVSQLADMTDEQLLELPGIGPVSIKTIRSALIE